MRFKYVTQLIERLHVSNRQMSSIISPFFVAFSYSFVAFFFFPT